MMNNINYKTIICSAIILLACMLPLCSIQAQREVRKKLRDGNALLEKKGKINEAEASYREALKISPNNKIGNFNLGNALYREGKFDDAKAQYENTAKNIEDKNEKAKVYHNIGNSLMAQKKYSEALEAYKKSLIDNPKDDKTRYNLAYAQAMIQQQQQQNKNNKDNKDKNNKDKDKDKQNKDKKENKDQNKDPQNQHKPDQSEQQKKQEQEQQQQAGEMSKDEVNRLLDALTDNEKDLQKKMDAKKAQPRGASDKNW